MKMEITSLIGKVDYNGVAITNKGKEERARQCALVGNSGVGLGILFQCIPNQWKNPLSDGITCQPK